MCTGGNLGVRQNLVVLSKKNVGWKNWVLFAILQWEKNDSTIIHCTWEPVYCWEMEINRWVYKEKIKKSNWVGG